MNTKVNIRRRFVIAGKEYTSVEEMPPDIREAFEEAMASRTADPDAAKTKTRIVFNGEEYESTDDMPPDLRRFYEELLEEEAMSPDRSYPLRPGEAKDAQLKARTYDPGSLETSGVPDKIEPAPSGRAFLIGVLLIVFIVLVYFILGSR